MQWEVYSEEENKYEPQDIKDNDVLDVLEVTFLSNIKCNYDPIELGKKFSNCLIPKMEGNLHRKYALKFSTSCSGFS